MTAAPMTPAHIAVAIVAACGVTGTKPDKVFEDGNGRPRVMAAAGCIAHLGWDKLTTARAFRVHPNRLTPSGLSLARVFTQHLLAVAEALDAQGLGPTSKDLAKGEAAPVSPAPAAEARPRRKAGQAASAAEKPVDPPPPSPPAPKAAAVVRPIRTNPVRPRPTPARAIEKLKPVSDRIVRWTRQQLGLGADLTFVAWCFGVDVDALAAAVRPERAAA